MGEFNIEVFQVDKIEPHTNADKLEIVYYHGYPVVCRKGQFIPGQLAVYIPIDSIVQVNYSHDTFMILGPGDKIPIDPIVEVNYYPFDFLKTGETQLTHRVKARNLRGVYSQGLIVECPPLPSIGSKPFEVGDNLQYILGITKWEPAPEGTKFGKMIDVKSPSIHVPVYDLESWRKLSNIFQNDEKVIITEKLNGTNAKFLYLNNEFFVGSHRRWVQFDSSNLWWKMAKQYNLDIICMDHPGLVFYGEIYGNVQKGFSYGLQFPDLALFDVYNSLNGKWFNFFEFNTMCTINKLPMVPVLYFGSLNEQALELRNALSLKARKNGLTDHISEGIVIESALESSYEHYDHIYRKKLKFVGENYLLK